jgi:NAD(P)-dependent dehydrogenase (short-subunit alcohol dehydrogenase family)
MTAPLLEREGGAEALAARTAMGRIGREEELDGPLLLLASDAGSYLTGITLAVDGGWSMH